MQITWRQNKESKEYGSFKNKVDHVFKDFKEGRNKSSDYHIGDLDSAVNMLYMFRNKPVRFIGDYDTDGMSACINWNLLCNELNISDMEWYIPDRELDGYGASPDIVEYLCNNISIHGLPIIETKEPGLLVTADNGIAALEAMSRAKELGWKILILDHHLPVTDDNGEKKLPDADVIIDPHAVDCGADFKNYCGAGLVYKLAQYINGLNGTIPGWNVSDEVMAKITGIAAIATIGDSVNFIEENNGIYSYDNYLIVKDGLYQLTQNAGRTTGMYCLLLGINPKYETILTVDDIGFSISPVMNAVSRIEEFGSNKVIELFLQDDNDFISAAEKAKHLVETNELRKKYTNDLVPVLINRIKENNMQNDFPLIVCGKPNEIHPGIIGLVAGKLQEEFNTSVIVFAPMSDGTLKGSARAPKGTNMKKLLDENKSLILKYGGHAPAAGVSIEAAKLDEFTKAMQQSAGEKPKDLYFKEYDFEITPDMVEDELKIMDEIGCFGNGFNIPVYRIAYEANLTKGVYYQILGAEKKTLRLLNNYANAINFKNIIPKFAEMGEPTVLTLYGTLNWNVWNGKSTPQIMFDDIDY